MVTGRRPSVSLWDGMSKVDETFVRIHKEHAVRWSYAALTLVSGMAQYSFYAGDKLRGPIGYLRVPTLATQEDVQTMGDSLLMMFNMGQPQSDD